MKIIIFLLISLFSILLNAQELRPVSFPTTDSGSIQADYFQSGNKAVVLAHGAVFNKESWPELIEKLLKNKISVLAINFRGYGKSTAGNNPSAKYEDILAAVHYLHKQPGISQVSVLGASMGGGAAAQASIQAQPGEISKLILLSPMPVKEPEKLRGNILYIASKNEAMIDTMLSQYHRAPKPKQLELLEGHAHAQHIFKTPENKKLTSLIIHFLTQE